MVEKIGVLKEELKDMSDRRELEAKNLQNRNNNVTQTKLIQTEDGSEGGSVYRNRITTKSFEFIWRRFYLYANFSYTPSSGFPHYLSQEDAANFKKENEAMEEKLKKATETIIALENQLKQVWF